MSRRHCRHRGDLLRSRQVSASPGNSPRLCNGGLAGGWSRTRLYPSIRQSCLAGRDHRIFSCPFWTSLDTATFGGIAKSVTVPALIAGAAALQALAGAFLVRRFVGIRTALATEKEVARFSLVASSSCLITSTFAVTTLWLARVISSADFLTNWVTWYVGDSIGTLIFAPLVLIWTFRAADWRRKL